MSSTPAIRVAQKIDFHFKPKCLCFVSIICVFKLYKLFPDRQNYSFSISLPPLSSRVALAKAILPGWFFYRKSQPFYSLARLDCLRSEEHTSELQSRFDLVC